MFGIKNGEPQALRWSSIFAISKHQWKDLSIDFVTGLPILTNWKRDSYDSTLVIIDRLTKMVHYKLVKITINALGLAEVIIDVMVWYHSLLDSIITNRSSLFTSKFKSLLCYFFDIKRRLSTTFHLKLTAKQSGRSELWRLTSELLSTSSGMTGPGSYRWLSLHILMPKTSALVTHRLNSTAAIILAFFLKKIPILALDQK